VSLLAKKDFTHIKDPHARRDAIVEERRKEHDAFLQDAYNKTYKVVDDMLKEREEKLKRTV
jgi:hypothetical protein